MLRVPIQMELASETHCRLEICKCCVCNDMAFRDCACHCRLEKTAESGGEEAKKAEEAKETEETTH